MSAEGDAWLIHCLDQLECGYLTQIFVENEIDFDTFKTLTKEELEALLPGKENELKTIYDAIETIRAIDRETAESTIRSVRAVRGPLATTYQKNTNAVQRRRRRPAPPLAGYWNMYGFALKQLVVKLAVASEDKGHAPASVPRGDTEVKEPSRGTEAVKAGVACEDRVKVPLRGTGRTDADSPYQKTNTWKPNMKLAYSELHPCYTGGNTRGNNSVGVSTKFSGNVNGNTRSERYIPEIKSTVGMYATNNRTWTSSRGRSNYDDDDICSIQ